MRGLMASATGKTIEIPIKANFREGLSVLEFFISTHGSRKGLSDTALRTADSGYLTRRLVDVSQDVIVREEDCGSEDFIVVEDFKDGNAIIEKMRDRMIGRYSFEDLIQPQSGEIIVQKNEMITEDIADAIVKAGIKQVKVRSVLTCKARHGVCAKCYGRNLATGKPVNIGEAVGIIAAQSIGEPGTQLTMRTFHSGGIAGVGITQGLPRVEELFEARKPKGLASIAEIDGTVEVVDKERNNEVLITNEEGQHRSYNIPYGASLKVSTGDIIKAGTQLSEGSVNPHDVLKVLGPWGVFEYIVKEVQKVYRFQGVDIDDKHVEIIVKQMLSKVKIDDAGDSDFLPGSMVNLRDFEIENERLEKEELRKAEGIQELLGITKASLATDSFLSAASFQETTRVLTEASIKGKEDNLLGLKENVIIGKLIPAGTGMKRYNNISIDYEGKTEEDVENSLELEEESEENSVEKKQEIFEAETEMETEE